MEAKNKNAVLRTWFVELAIHTIPTYSSYTCCLVIYISIKMHIIVLGDSDNIVYVRRT